MLGCAADVLNKATNTANARTVHELRTMSVKETSTAGIEIFEGRYMAELASRKTSFLGLCDMRQIEKLAFCRAGNEKRHFPAYHLAQHIPFSSVSSRWYAPDLNRRDSPVQQFFIASKRAK